MSMNYVIIENETFARENLLQVIGRLRPAYRLVFTAETVEDSIAWFAKPQQVDLIFMDIELDDGNCFEIFRRVSIHTPVIFTTAYDEYALQAFKVNSVDYLLKPILDEDIEAALVKFEKYLTASLPDYSQLLTTLNDLALMHQPQGIDSPKPMHNRILVSSGDHYLHENISDVAFFMSEDKYVFLYLKSGRRRITDFESLSDILHALPVSDFFQLSRSIVCHIDAIASVSKHFKGRLSVTVKAGDVREEVLVSAARRKEFLDWLGYRPK